MPLSQWNFELSFLGNKSFNSIRVGLYSDVHSRVCWCAYRYIRGEKRPQPFSILSFFINIRQEGWELEKLKRRQRDCASVCVCAGDRKERACVS